MSSQTAKMHNEGIALGAFLVFIGFGVFEVTSAVVGLALLIGAGLALFMALLTKGGKEIFVVGLIVDIILGTLLLAVSADVLALAANETLWQYVQGLAFLIPMFLNIGIFATVFFVSRPRR